MTTICFRDGILASDSLVTCNGRREGEFKKIGRANGWLFGVAGTIHLCEAFKEWFKTECRDGKLRKPPAEMYHNDDRAAMAAILIEEATGRVFCIENMGKPYPWKANFYAIGSGSDFAYGALEMGADARTAVKVASALDTATGGKILTLKTVQ